MGRPRPAAPDLLVHHAGLVHAALDAGLPAFCEKPVAPGLAETQELVRAVEVSGVPVMVGFQRRSDPAYQELRRRLCDGELGTPYLVRMVVGDDAIMWRARVAFSAT